MRYLEILLSPKKWSKIECHQVVLKIVDRIRGWSAGKLSYTGRLLLVQSVLQSLHSYWSSTFVLPSSILKEVDRRCREFLWVSYGSGAAKALVSWHQVCCDQQQGV